MNTIENNQIKKNNMIKVIGIGGGGCNAVNYMYNSFTTQGVDFILCNTDSQVLEHSTIQHKVQLGIDTTEGLGAGGDIEIGQKATEESVEQIKEMLDTKTKMVFIATTLGGGTGSGGAPVIAKICKEMGILTVAIVTRPLSKGSKLQIANAEKSIESLRQYADTLLIISNDKLIQHYGTQKMSEAFKKADDVLASAVQSIVSLITSKGYINVDFADVKKVMINGETGMFGMAKTNGENRALNAIEEAMSCPLLDYEDISGARWALVNVATPIGEYEVTFDDIQSIQDFIMQKTGNDTEIKIGLTYDEMLEDYIAVTIIATGFRQQKNIEQVSFTDNNAIIDNAKKSKPKQESKSIVFKLNEEEKEIEEQEIPLAEQTEFRFDSPEENDIFINQSSDTDATIALQNEEVSFIEEEIEDPIFMDQEVSHKEMAKFDEEDIFKQEEDIFNQLSQIDKLRQEIIEKSNDIDVQENVSKPSLVQDQNNSREKLKNMSFQFPDKSKVGYRSFQEEQKSVAKTTQLRPPIFEEKPRQTISIRPSFSTSFVEQNEYNEIHIRSKNKFLEGNQPD